MVLRSASTTRERSGEGWRGQIGLHVPQQRGITVKSNRAIFPSQYTGFVLRVRDRPPRQIGHAVLAHKHRVKEVIDDIVRRPGKALVPHNVVDPLEHIQNMNVINRALGKIRPVAALKQPDLFMVIDGRKIVIQHRLPVLLKPVPFAKSLARHGKGADRGQVLVGDAAPAWKIQRMPVAVARLPGVRERPLPLPVNRWGDHGTESIPPHAPTDSIRTGR